MDTNTNQQPQSPQSAVEQTPIPPKPSVDSKILLVAVILFIVVMIGLITYVLTAKTKPTSQPPTISLTIPQPTPTSSPLDELSNWKIYTNDDYSLKYPPDWDNGILEDKNCGGIDFYLKTLISTSFSICKPNTNSDDTPDNLARISLGSNKLLSRTDISVDGHKGIVQEIQLINGNYKQIAYIGDVLTKVTLEDGRIENKPGTFVITFTESDQLKFKNTKVVVNQILPTFIFLNQGKTSDTTKWKIYKNQKYGFEIKYPMYWYTVNYYDVVNPKSLSKNTDEHHWLLFGKGYKPKEIYALTHGWPDLNISVGKKLHSDKELQKTGIEQGAELEGNILNKSEYTQLTFNGLPANKRIGLSEALIEANQSTLIIFNKNNYGWFIQYPNIDYKGNHEEIYDQILSTFQFSE